MSFTEPEKENRPQTSTAVLFHYRAIPQKPNHCRRWRKDRIPQEKLDCQVRKDQRGELRDGDWAGGALARISWRQVATFSRQLIFLLWWLVLSTRHTWEEGPLTKEFSPLHMACEHSCGVFLKIANWWRRAESPVGNKAFPPQAAFSQCFSTAAEKLTRMYTWHLNTAAHSTT